MLMTIKSFYPSLLNERQGFLLSSKKITLSIVLCAFDLKHKYVHKRQNKIRSLSVPANLLTSQKSFS